MQEEIISLLPIRKGHFRLESGHHGDLWLDLELLCLDPKPIRRLARELAARLRKHNAEILCGPLIEGAFVALMVAEELGLPFCYSEPRETATKPENEPQTTGKLYPVQYRIPRALRPKVKGKRVAIVNDVINAGSAVRGTISDLRDCHAQPVAIATLLVLGSWAHQYAAENNLTLETLASLPNTLWKPDHCPLCRDKVPLSG